MTEKSPRRDAEATKERILQVGTNEFCKNGLAGSRIQVIAEKSECNIRMIYHYFDSKEGLYLASLKRVYGDIRNAETEIGLTDLEPGLAVQTLVELTFDHHADNREFVGLVVAENLQGGEYLSKIDNVSTESHRLIENLSQVLQFGAHSGRFRDNVDAFQLYLTILSLSFFHLSNRDTLEVVYERNLQDRDWIAERRRHVVDVVLGFLRP